MEIQPQTDKRFILSPRGGGKGRTLAWSCTRGAGESSESQGSPVTLSTWDPRIPGPPRRQFTSLVQPSRVIQTNPDLNSESGKRRSVWFFLAKNRFRTIADLGNLEFSALEQMKLRDLEIYFDNWRAGYRDRYVHLEKEQRHLFIRQYSRFDSSYRKKLRRKLAPLDNVLWDLKIELTIDPKKTMRLADGYALLFKGLNRFNSWLKRRFGQKVNGKFYPAEFMMFACREIQKSGRLHPHILISGIKWIEQNELSDLWDSYGCGKIVYIKRVHSRNNLKMSAYVMKYVNKSLRIENKRYSSLLFASNRRLFSMNGSCQKMVRLPAAKENQGFKYVGTVAENELLNYCDERGLNLAPFMSIDVDRADLYEFPNIFGGEGG